MSTPPATSPTAPGKVAFVGAGPGHPDLLTRRAITCLKAADVVVHDQLVPPSVLDLAAPTAIRMPVAQLLSGGRTGNDPGRQIGRWLAKEASQGQAVVRLKGGDPTVFARLREELEPVTGQQIPFEIVPGVTAATAAATAAGVPLTDRQTASSLTIVTGHEAAAKPQAIDYHRLAATSGTIVIYMGVEQSAHWSEGLLAAGRPADTPVTLVSRCSWPDQHIVETTLAACAATIRVADLPAPAIAIIGGRPAGVPAVTQGPLAGRRLLISRPAGQAADLLAEISRRGGEPLHLPLIEIGPPPDAESLQAAVAAASSFDWIVFASVNGVRSFAACLRAAGQDARALGTARLAAIGPATRAALADCGLACDLVPDCFRSEGVVEAIAESVHRGRFLLIRADKGRDVLRQELEARGHQVEQVAAYSSRPLAELSPATEGCLQQFPCDWMLVTSSSIATTAVRLFGEQLRALKIASISPVTTATLEAAGFPPTVEAAEATTPAILEVIEAHERHDRTLAARGSRTGRADAAGSGGADLGRG